MENNIFSLENGNYINALGDNEIRDEDWDNTEELRNAFENFIELNFENSENIIYICNFESKKISIYKLERVFK